LEHGFNVLCEKPLAQTAAQVDELIARRDTSGRMLAVFQQSRFEPYFEQLKAIIASGVLGRIVQISMKFSSYSRRWDWQTLKEFGGGILYNKGPHPLDQALNLLDFYQGNPGVFCKMDRTNTWGDAEDYVKLIVTAPGRPLVDLEISSCDAYAAGISYAVQGTSGGLEGNEKRQNWRWFVASETPGQELTREPLHDKDWNPLFCEEHINWHEDSWQIGPGNGDANGGNADGGNADADGGNAASIPVGKLYANVYEHLLKGIPLIVTPEQVRQQIWVMEEAHRQNPLPG
jgi:predicted dehydrogenase